MPPTLLIVDDERAIVDSLVKVFDRRGLDVVGLTSAREAIDVLRQRPVSVVLTDLMMPETSGLDLLRAARTVAPETEVIVMTAYATVENAVEAMKEGAYDFVTKPVKRAQVQKSVDKALEKLNLVIENRTLRAQLEAQKRRRVVGTSLAMRRTLDVVTQAAPSSATVLLLGESGTGKELLARALHEESPRAAKPFVAVNCAALPESILEAELFGYERGAFTGAVTRRDGRFGLADGGTLFLDEIGEIPAAVQVKLLRVLQEGEIERLGGGRPVKVDIRLVAATNQDLARAVREGRFREDLYYRLNVIAVTVPPLRDRRDDIPLLTEHFLRQYAGKNGKPEMQVSRAAMQRLLDWEWPGNVRELENAIERAVVLAKGPILEEHDLPQEIAAAQGGHAGSTGGARTLTFAIGTPLAEIERRVLHETLRHTRGDKRLAAQLLGVATRTVYRKLADEADGAHPEAQPGDEAPDAKEDAADRDEQEAAASLIAFPRIV